jgi:hypothetical protein
LEILEMNVSNTSYPFVRVDNSNAQSLVDELNRLKTTDSVRGVRLPSHPQKPNQDAQVQRPTMADILPRDQSPMHIATHCGFGEHG